MNTPAGLLSPVWADTEAAQLTSEQALLTTLVEVEAAWAEVLAEAGEAPAAGAAALRAIATDPAAAGLDPAEIAAAGVGGGNPVIPLLAQLRSVLNAQETSDEALHRGATSQDVLDTALVLTVHRACAAALRDARATADALAELAETHRSTVCVARSLTQHALPTSFGLRVAGWLDGICRAAVRLSGAVAELPIQWGGAAGTQAALTDMVGTARAAELTRQLGVQLGLPTPSRPWHTQRQPLLEVASALAGLLAAMGKAANDVLTLQRQEIAEVRESASGQSGGSSAMPQKQNPVLSVLIRSAALAGPAQLAGLHYAAASAVDERPDGPWHAEWPQLLELLRLTCGAAARGAELFAGLITIPENMARNLRLTGGAVLSERLVAALSDSFPGGKSALLGVISASSAGGTSLRAEITRAYAAAGSVAPELDRLLDPADYLGRADDFIDAVLADFAAERTTWS